MKRALFLVALLCAACDGGGLLIVTPKDAGSGGSGGEMAASTSTSGSGGGTTSTGTGGAPADAGTDAWPPTQCNAACEPYAGGACVCDPAHAPNCPAGYAKICCAGNGAPCAQPDPMAIPAMPPVYVPGWCSPVSPMCHPSPCAGLKTCAPNVVENCPDSGPKLVTGECCRNGAVVFTCVETSDASAP